MSGKAEKPDEFALIERYFAPLASQGAFAFRDDAALLGQPGHPVILTQDALAEGVHFFPEDPAGLVAQKAIRVNLSDLAAKGAVPAAISIALGLPEQWTETWVAGFADGIAADCRQYDIALTGGDTFRSPGGIVIAVTALGELREGEYRSRLGANEGDRLFVTGTIGDGALGLIARKSILGLADKPSALDEAQLETLQSRYLLPDPPVGFAGTIAQFASASMDISDGLAGDLEKLAAASDFDMAVNATDVPLSAEVAALAGDTPMLALALTGGDDYQILFTVPRERMEPMLEAATATGTRVAELGQTRPGEGKVTFLDAAGRAMTLTSKSWNHFA